MGQDGISRRGEGPRVWLRGAESRGETRLVKGTDARTKFACGDEGL